MTCSGHNTNAALFSTVQHPFGPPIFSSNRTYLGVYLMGHNKDIHPSIHPFN